MRHSRSPRPGRRPGKVLVLFAMLLPVLLGLVGLVVDGGLMMAAQRRAQNAADAAALGAAMDMMRGFSSSTARTTAQSFLATNGVSGVTLTLNGGASNALNIPPQDPYSTGSPYQGNANYAEVMLTVTVRTLFIQVLGVNANQQVTARAVAGFEPVGAGEGAIVLNPNAAPGVSVSSNNSRLIVNGTLVVNSQGTGKDQYGATVGTINHPAISTGGPNIVPAPIVALDIQVVGGVDTVDNLRVYDAAFTTGTTPNYYYDPNNPDRPLFASAPIAPDPLASLATPTTTSAGASTSKVNSQSLGAPAITNNSATGVVAPNTYDSATQTTTLNPGIYSSISITGGNVIFNSGIYVLTGGSTNTLKINGGTVTGTNVMFYNTGSDYNPADGSPDVYDGSTLGSTSASFGSIAITGGTVTLTPLIDSTSPFDNMLIYQRRWNNSDVTVGGNSTDLHLSGTVYAKWASLKITGQGSYSAQFLVGDLSVSGGGIVTIVATGKNFGRANLVFLVE